jgi:hypothetical protein
MPSPSTGIIGNLSKGLAIQAITPKKNVRTTIIIAIAKGKLGLSLSGDDMTAIADIIDRTNAIYNKEPSLPA